MKLQLLGLVFIHSSVLVSSYPGSFPSCSTFLPPYFNTSVLYSFYPFCDPHQLGIDYSWYHHHAIPYNYNTSIDNNNGKGIIFGTREYLQLPDNGSINFPVFTLSFRYIHLKQYDTIPGNDWSLNFIANDYGYNLLELSSYDNTLGSYSLYHGHVIYPNIKLSLDDETEHILILTGNPTTFTLYMDTIDTIGSIPAFDLTKHIAKTIGNDFYVNHIQPCRGIISDLVIYNTTIEPQILLTAYKQQHNPLPQPLNTVEPPHVNEASSIQPNTVDTVAETTMATITNDLSIDLSTSSIITDIPSIISEPSTAETTTITVSSATTYSYDLSTPFGIYSNISDAKLLLIYIISFVSIISLLIRIIHLFRNPSINTSDLKIQ